MPDHAWQGLGRGHAAHPAVPLGVRAARVCMEQSMEYACVGSRADVQLCCREEEAVGPCLPYSAWTVMHRQRMHAGLLLACVSERSNCS